MSDFLTLMGVLLYIAFLGLVTIGFWAIGAYTFMEWIFT